VIRRVTLKRFKRFEEETFDRPGNIVLAGPNNTGKSTVLQAIAAWGFALNRWKQLNNFQRRGGSYEWAPIVRQTFAAVPLRSFDLLWKDRNYRGTIEITLVLDECSVTMELDADSTEQIYVRPKDDVEPAALRRLDLNTVYVPAMSGLSTDEPVLQPPKINQLLGQARPGEVLRNLLLAASQSADAWDSLKDSIKRLFGYVLVPPNGDGPDIIAEYAHSENGPRFDIASDGSGFQQVLMLVTFLLTRPASILLVDEPVAHLHVILQDIIYDELRGLAVKQKSQLIIATHSEVIINAVDPRELCMMFGRPRMLASTEERSLLMNSLGWIENNDLILAENARGILYVEGHTDLAILREWARILDHAVYPILTKDVFWKPLVWELRNQGRGIKAQDHYEGLKLVRDDLPGLILMEGDDNPNVPETPITGRGLQRLRWKRYEIESYLVLPIVLARFVESVVGDPSSAKLHIEDLYRHFEETYPPAFLRNPMADIPMLIGTKARRDLIPPALEAAGIHGIEYTSFYEIAALMRPEEIHPEVIEKLDAIQRAFNL
jgi:hypothetical protein